MFQNEGTEQVYHIMSSTWLKMNLDFNNLKCFRIKELSMIVTNYLNHGWGKVWSTSIWNIPKWKNLAWLSQNIFSMVEEKLGFQQSEILKNEGIAHDNHRIYSPWLDKNLDFSYLKFLKMRNCARLSQSMFTYHIIDIFGGLLWARKPWLCTGLNFNLWKSWLFYDFFLIFLTIPERVSSPLPNKKIL